MKKLFKYCFNTSKWSPSKSEWLALISSLPKEERQRISGYAFKQDQKQTLMGQILIRYTLRCLLNIRWNHLAIQRDAKNRPGLSVSETIKLTGNSKNVAALFKTNLIDFNVTHSGDYTAIVTGLMQVNSSGSSEPSTPGVFKLGTDMMKIDIERSRLSMPEEANIYDLYENELRRYERVINSKFGENERQFIEAKSNSIEKLTAFYRLWCLKESYVKAVGDGVAFDLRRIECQINNELFIDLNASSPNRNKCLVVDSTRILVDSKPASNCKFYEQYYLNRVENQHDHLHHYLPELYIVTFCIIESAESTTNTVSSSSSSGGGASQTESLLEEFKEITLADIMSSLVPIEALNPTNEQEYEQNWTTFSQKTERPFSPKV